MHVQVKDGLARTGPNVQHGSVTLLDSSLPRDLCRRQVTAPDDLGIAFLRFFQPGKMSFGNDQHMRRRLRIDILKRKNVLVFVNFLRGNLSVNNPAEKAIGSLIHDPQFYPTPVQGDPRTNPTHVQIGLKYKSDPRRGSL